ncbi:MAG TPA: cupin domain-containing protein [Anaerolineae bacterium]|nr:cupin domain-containing protein [Anaerolineae bacterium]
MRHDDATPVEMLPGLVRRTLVWGEKMMLCEFTAEAGVIVPMHSHPHEQVGYVLSGRVQFTVDGETWIAGPGDSYAIPGGVEHEARVLEPTVLIELFSPPREAFKT